MAVPVKWNTRNFDNIYHNNVVKLLEFSAAAAEEKIRYPLIDMYTGLFRNSINTVADAERSFKEYSIDPTEISTKIHDNEHFPYTLLDYLINKKLKEASKEWIFVNKHDPANPSDDEKALQNYHIYSIIKFYHNGFAETMYKTADASVKIETINEARASPTVQSKMFLYNNSRTFLGEMFRKGTQILSFNQYNSIVVGEVNKTWNEYVLNIFKTYNKSLFARALADNWGRLKIDVSDDDKAKKERYLIYAATADYFIKSHAKTIHWARIDKLYDDSEREIKEVLDEYFGRDRTQEALSDVLDYVARAWETATPSAGGMSIDDLKAATALDDDDKSRLKRQTKEVKHMAVEIQDLVKETNKDIRELLRRLHENFYVNFRAMSDRHLENVLVKYGLDVGIEADNLKAEFPDVQDKVKLFIQSLLEPVVYRATALALLQVIINKFCNEMLKDLVETSEGITS